MPRKWLFQAKRLEDWQFGINKIARYLVEDGYFPSEVNAKKHLLLQIQQVGSSVLNGCHIDKINNEEDLDQLIRDMHDPRIEVRFNNNIYSTSVPTIIEKRKRLNLNRDSLFHPEFSYFENDVMLRPCGCKTECSRVWNA